jgi:hypothetical protein
MMKQDYRKIEEIDTIEEYEMIPLEPRMYEYDQEKAVVRRIVRLTLMYSEE